MSADLQTRLQQVCTQVHGRFRYVPDLLAWGKPEYWASLQDDAKKLAESGIVTGDCDDFALLCRTRLDAAGIENHLVSCITETGEYHLVCEADGGWILDCRYQQVMPRELLDYQWISRSGTHPGEAWHLIG